MQTALIPPADASVLGIPTVIFSFLIPIAGIAVFAYIIAMRIVPLLKAAPDPRLNRIGERLKMLLKMWLLQYRHPRYLLAGVLHISLFAGFLILSIRSFSMVMVGISADFVVPGFSGALGHVYHVLKDYAATLVLAACIVAAVRRAVFKPERYAVPQRYGRDHTWEALFVLGLIATLMITESLFDASAASAQIQQGLPTVYPAPASLAWAFTAMLGSVSVGSLQSIHLAAYYLHDLSFFFFMCFLPLGKHFHVITSIFNVFSMRLERGNIKPVRHGVDDEQLDDLSAFGVVKLEDFTWKHLLDFYTCADCGRCSDNCPANAVKRPLSPRFITIKGRDLVYRNYPVYPVGAPFAESPALVGSIYEEDEIWSCTTCGACEQECPLTIEYIDKIVDLRRGMVDAGIVPQSLQKPLGALEKRGNPWGKMERKRADWVKALPEDVPVRLLDKKTRAETLYFVDSISSFDDRMQAIARSTARVLTAAGEDFGILGKAEKDSAHEVRRFGEEMLFQDLRAHNTAAILKSGVERIVTADPHAYNALTHDYQDIPPVMHISQYLARAIRSGGLQLSALADAQGKVVTFHDPCYLGRHNKVYDAPRAVIDAIPGLKRIDMQRCRDRSFCCGGGGLMLFYEPEEEQRMGVLRVEMAAESGADVIITACPFCLVNIEDAIKVAGMEDQMTALDLVELVDRHLTGLDSNKAD